MAQQNLTIGTANAGAGDTPFAAFTKVQANFTDLYTRTSPSRTGSALTFDLPAIYNTSGTPATGAITYDFTGAVANTSIYLYYNAAALSLPSGSTIVGGVFYANNLNLITFIYRDSTHIDVVIDNLNASAYTNPTVVYHPPADVSTTGTTGISIGISVTILAGQTYVIDGLIGIGCNNTGGVVFGTNHTVTPTDVFFEFLGRSSGSTAFIQGGSINGVGGYNAVLTTTAYNTLNNQNGFVYVKGKVIGGVSDSTFTVIFASLTGGQTSTVYKNRTYLSVTKA
jgi:hypothetical protein